MSGEIHVEISDRLPKAFTERLTVLSEVLNEKGLSLSVINQPLNNHLGILINVVDVEDISESSIRTLLKVIFNELQPLGNAKVVLKDDEKSFDLPDDMEECIDWFVIE